MCLFKIYRKYRSTPKQKTEDKRRGFPGRPLGGRGGHVGCCCYTVKRMEDSSTKILQKTLSIERIGAHGLFVFY